MKGKGIHVVSVREAESIGEVPGFRRMTKREKLWAIYRNKEGDEFMMAKNYCGHNRCMMRILNPTMTRRRNENMRVDTKTVIPV